MDFIGREVLCVFHIDPFPSFGTFLLDRRFSYPDVLASARPSLLEQSLPFLRRDASS